jgi:hypothetical protein
MASVVASTTSDQQEPEDNAGYRTPTKEKRKSPDDFYTEMGRTPKKVSFGPDLNPEIFSKNNPPNTPIKRGEHHLPTASTPSFMAKLAAAGGTPKSILTPSRSSRTNVFQGLEKPTPLKLKLFSPELQKTITTPKNQAIVERDASSSASRKPASGQDESASDSSSGNHSDASLREKIGSTSTVSPFIVPTTTTESEKFKGDVEEEGDDDNDDESPPSTPTRTPAARQSSERLSSPIRSRLQLSNHAIPEEHLHHSFKLHAQSLQPDADNPFISNEKPHGDSPSQSPTIAAVQRHHPDLTDAIEEELDTPLIAEAELLAETEPETVTRDIDIPDTSPVHTPIRNRTKDDQKSKVTPGGNTPGSASRLALLQLSAQKIRGLPDLLQSPSSTAFARESTETAPAVPEPSADEIESGQDGHVDVEATPVADNDVATEKAEEEATLVVLESGNEVTDDQPEDEDKEEEEEDQIPEPMVEDDNESAGDEAEHEADDALAKDDAQYNLEWPSGGADSKRRMSAPAASTILRPQSPIFNGLRGVFRTPQKVVETCFAGFTGFRNFVMTPTRSPKQPSKELFAQLPKTEPQAAEGDENPFEVKSDDTKEEDEAVETLDVQKIATTNGSVRRGPELAEFTFSVRVGGQKTSAEDNADQSTDENETAISASRSIRPASTATTPKRRISSHQDALALLTGHSGELSPKSKEFTFATDSLEQIKARGRRSDVFPQKRTVAKRSLSQSAGKEEAKNETDDKDDSNRRRRTISMFEFMAAVSSSTTTTTTTTTVTQSSGNANVESQEQRDGAGDGDDAEQAELLRLLGEGAESGEDDDESASDGIGASQHACSYDVVSDGRNDEYSSNGTDEALLDDSKEVAVKVSPRRKSESFPSNGNTPTKRRQSFRSRLGSSSPGFGLYEGDDDEEDDEDDDVIMISPKRIRVLE